VSNTPSRNDFAQSDEEARQRFELFESKDPLQEIRPALLNSADIFDYVRLTGMIWPFDPNPVRNKLKSASYEVDFMGDLHLVHDSKSYEKIEVRKGGDYHLPKNSISFLFLETTFRLPDYIAARFNLRIRHVHSGLLLGTGPLIDPGFAGRLLIPLHNLTSEDYLIRGDDGLIWVEFTKLSENKRWNSACSREGEYRPFPKTHRYLPASKYFEKASPRGVPVPASSSIPGEIRKSVESAERAAKSAEGAAKSVKDARNWVRVISGIGFLALVAIVVSIYQLVQTTNKNIGDASKNISDYRENQILLEKRLDDLKSDLKDLRAAKKVPSSAQKSP
jgi:deoxycytidine triphosphate deaminase